MPVVRQERAGELLLSTWRVMRTVIEAQLLQLERPGRLRRFRHDNEMLTGQQ
jgi:hypothetical protein